MATAAIEDPVVAFVAEWQEEHEDCPCPVTHLCQSFSLTPSSLEAFLGLLAAEGLIERVADGLGAHDVKLSPLGWAMVREA